MDETTTSTQDDSAQAGDDQELDTSTNEQAVNEGDETSDDTSSQETDANGDDTDSDETNSEEDIKAWAEKKGLPLDDPIALAKMVREGDRKVTEATQKASNLSKSVDNASADMGLEDVEQLRNKVAVMEFYQLHPEARELDSEMANVLEEKPYFASDLEGLFYYTKGKLSGKDVIAARQAGGKEALAAVAQAERAGGPKASATVRETPKALTDADIANMTVAEYDAAVASGKIDPWAH